jgi:hypothetical protein
MVYLLLFAPISIASAWEASLDRCTIRAAATGSTNVHDQKRKSHSLTFVADTRAKRAVSMLWPRPIKGPPDHRQFHGVMQQLAVSPASRFLPACRNSFDHREEGRL